LKKLLIISYHALPLDVVASYRTKAFCDYLKENDVLPTLVTHRWEKEYKNEWKYHKSNEKELYEFNGNYNIIRLPRPNETVKSNSSLVTLSYWLKGEFDLHLSNSYKVFKNFLFQHLKNNRYDAILAIFSPHFHLKLAYEIHKKFKIPYILDFRDLWDNQVVTKSYKPTLKKDIQDRIIQYYWKRWLGKSMYFSTTSEKWLKLLENLTPVKGIKVRNGHEISEISTKKFKTNKFRVAYFGRIYQYQNLKVIIEGINLFIKQYNPKNNFEICLIGIKSVDQFSGSDIFKSLISKEFIKEYDYIPKKELIDFSLKKVSTFILPNLNEDNGSFFVKLFDFISIGRAVILAPKNGSENDLVLGQIKRGLITSSPNEIAEYLGKKFLEFKSSGVIESLIDHDLLASFHRSKQVENFAKHFYKQF
tara:strand:+ start:39630 stop:40886 length:1257 start_codon:yes stop_codon:yes gene_type:complete